MKDTKKPVKKNSKKIVKTKEKPKTRANGKDVRGRDAKYAPWMNGVANRLAKEGYSQKQIYHFLGISEATGIKYKDEYEEFFKALQDGYQNPITVAEKKLFKLVKGYEFDSEQIVVVSDGSQIGAHVERVPIKKRVEPNLRAIEYFLNNRKSKKEFGKEGWGEEVSVEHSGSLEYKITNDEELEPEK